MNEQMIEDIAWLRERAFHTEKAGDEEILERVARTLETFAGVAPERFPDPSPPKASAYNPNERLIEALERIDQVSMRGDMSLGFRLATIQRAAREARSPLPQGED